MITEPDRARSSEVPADPVASAREVRGLARGGGLSLVTMIFNQAVRLLITLVIGRVLGEAAVGRFYQAFAFHELLALFAAAGFKLALTRYVAIHRSRDDDGALKGVLRLGFAVPTGIAFAIAGVLALAAAPLSVGVFDDPQLSRLLLLVALVLPASVFTDVVLAATQGYGTMRPSALVGFVLEPALRLSLSLGAIALGWGVAGAMGALVVTNMLAAVVAWFWFRHLSGTISAAPAYRFRELFAFSRQTWGSSMATYALIWFDTLLLGALDTSGSVGVYQVASRIVLLGAVFIIPLGSALAPRIARFHEEGKQELVLSTYRMISAWVLRLGVPFFLVLLFFPEPLLRLFGSQFVAGATATSVLAIGGLFNAVTGPTDVVLAMCGRPGLVLVNNVSTLALNIVLNLLFIPLWGVNGAAIAWTASLVYMNVLFLIQIQLTLRVNPFGKPFVKTGLAGVVALVAALVLDSDRAMISDMVIVFAAYLGMIVFLGFDNEERIAMRALRGWRSTS